MRLGGSFDDPISHDIEEAVKVRKYTISWRERGTVNCGYYDCQLGKDVAN